MKLYEYMAKEIFKNNGIPVPKGRVFTSAEEVTDFVAQIGPVALKSQVLSGGRGKAGGIKFASDPQEAADKARELLASDFMGLKVDTILVERKLSIEKELYLVITYDRARRKPLLIASAAGGINIEKVAKKLLVKRLIDINIGLQPYATREITRQLGLTGQIAKEVADIMLKLYQIFRKYDAEIVEINPLVVADSQVFAADAKMVVDDEAAFRFSKDVPLVEEKTAVEKKAAELGISYVELDGEIGVMANGAGITMATLDLIKAFGSSSRNFMDAGGGSSREATASALEILLSVKPKALLINIFGGITRCDDVAKAFIQVKETIVFQIPVVIRLAGTNEETGRALLREHGIESYSKMDEAVAKVVAFVNAKGE
ncbi:MAG: succinyl-CoA synthetase subunit beta [Desulfosporosinus sp. BRH_c37]|nr:MAG: succinyl-CoA synthetase subunit beta [Desulfosporosinus sp. BRH_c37]